MRIEAMSEHSIICSGESVRGILAGLKRQTRRVITEQDCWRNGLHKKIHQVCLEKAYPVKTGAYLRVPYRHRDDSDTPWDECGSWRVNPRWQVGDLLWVKETWRCTGGGSWYGITYKATENPADVRAFVGCEREQCLMVAKEYAQKWEHYVYETNRSCDWRSALFMPKWACRLWLKVKAVRAERLQDISEEDAKAEGVKDVIRFGESGYEYYDPCSPKKLHNMRCSTVCKTARRSFRGLWDSINAKRGYGWDKNDLVWVTEFERELQRPEKGQGCLKPNIRA